MIAARVLHGTYRALDHAATGVLLVADWCERTAWALDPDPRVSVAVMRLERFNTWPLDPDGYHVDGQHKDEL